MQQPSLNVDGKKYRLDNAIWVLLGELAMTKDSRNHFFPFQPKLDFSRLFLWTFHSMCWDGISFFFTLKDHSHNFVLSWQICCFPLILFHALICVELLIEKNLSPSLFRIATTCNPPHNPPPPPTNQWILSSTVSGGSHRKCWFTAMDFGGGGGWLFG